MTLLDVSGVSSGYGTQDVLHEVTITVDSGEVVAVLGANGAGKSTLMNTIVGLIPVTKGAIRWDGEEIGNLPTESIVRRGLTLVPEGRRIFAELSVEENLIMGSYGRDDRDSIDGDLHRVYQRFPILADRRSQPAGTFSGGEQQQLAIARALMSHPRMILLDEPSLGLAPVVVSVVFELIADLKETEGLTVLLVEQSIGHALDTADRVYVLAGGRVVREGTSAEMTDAAADIEASYLGGRS